MGQQLETALPPLARAAHYRQVADDTESLGDAGTAEFRETCRLFAARWRKLAEELEAAEFDSVPEEPAPRRHKTSRAAPPPAR